LSHTGALAGADRMYDALFKQVGVIRAQTFADLIDIPPRCPPGAGCAETCVAILTSTGGAGTLVSDDLGMAGFRHARARCGNRGGAARAADRRPRGARPQPDRRDAGRTEARTAARSDRRAV
jgi:hypothetical protein